MVYILLAEGFEETEALAPCDLMRRAGLQVALVGVNGPVISGSHGIRVAADAQLCEVSLADMELLMLPGGLRGVASILSSPEAMALIEKADRAEKRIAAICAAPTILAKLGITDGKQATCYPGKEPEMGSAVMVPASTVRDGRILTGRAAGSSLDFGLMLIEELFGPDAAEKVARGIVYAR